MSATALVSGKLSRDPQRKVSKSNKQFVSALLKEGEGDTTTWWNLLAFNESAIEELSSLKAGDALAASGSFKAEIFEKGEVRRVSFTLFVDKVITAKRQKRERPIREVEDRSQADRFDDGLPL